MTWSPPTIVQPTFGHPYCDRCGAVIVEEAKAKHVEWHRTIHDCAKSTADAVLLLTMNVMPEAVAGLDGDALDRVTEIIRGMTREAADGDVHCP